MLECHALFEHYVCGLYFAVLLLGYVVLAAEVVAAGKSQFYLLSLIDYRDDIKKIRETPYFYSIKLDGWSFLCE